MNRRMHMAIAIAIQFTIAATGTALAQDDSSEDCTSCRTNNFYYVLVAAIIIFAVFFWWSNRHKVPKEPDEKV